MAKERRAGKIDQLRESHIIFISSSYEADLKKIPAAKTQRHPEEVYLADRTVARMVARFNKARLTGKFPKVYWRLSDRLKSCEESDGDAP
jgi:hypothetical protein